MVLRNGPAAETGWWVGGALRFSKGLTVRCAAGRIAGCVLCRRAWPWLRLEVSGAWNLSRRCSLNLQTERTSRGPREAIRSLLQMDGMNNYCWQKML